MIRSLFILLFLLGAGSAQADYERRLSTAELLAQTDVVVIGRLTNVKEWSVDKVDYGEGTIEVTETLMGALSDSKKLTLRWSNPQYTSGRLGFKETGKAEFVWLLWRAQDGTFRVRHSGQKLPLDQKMEIVAGIEKRKAEQTLPSNGHKPTSGASSTAPTAPADAH